MTADQSLGQAVREYVLRKFGSHEAVTIIISHESMRYLLADFTAEWINTRAKPEPFKDNDVSEEGR